MGEVTFTPEDLRPASLEAGKIREIENDIKWLAERRDAFVAVRCPACGQEGRTAFVKDGFCFEECPSCRTVFMSPRATSTIMGEFYRRSATYAYWDKYVFPASRDVRKDRVFRPRVRRICDLCDRHGIIGGTALDVGAAVGMFCETLRESDRFRRVVALEPNREQAATCRSIGLETVEGDFFALEGFDESIDLITSFEVIEHLFSATEFLDRCHALLAPRGMIAITCPNQFGFDIQTLGQDSQSFDVEHVNMFNPAALIGLFERCGFEVLECLTPGEMDASIVRDAVLAGRLSLNNQPFLQEVLVDQWDRLGRPFQDFLKANGLSSHLWLVALRREP